MSGNNSKAKKDVSNDDVKREQKLQAVILCDCDQHIGAFDPIVSDVPAALIPIVNIPTIEYIIEFLSQNSIEEIFVFSIHHSDIVKDYIESRAKATTSTNMKIECIHSTTCLSKGDALRELDSLGVIRSDPFILVNSDTVCNIKLDQAIIFHKDRRKEDPNMIMTMILRETNSNSKRVVDDLVLAYDSSSHQIVYFENDIESSKCRFPKEILSDHPNIQFSTSLEDCSIDICSPEVLVQFSDNFDYQDIRRDFIRNEVVNYELGMHIYGYFLKNEYSAQVKEPRGYHTVSRDIVARWSYPISPDSQLLHLYDTNYKHIRRGVYFDDTVKVMRSSNINESLIGKQSVIANNVIIERSSVGKNCRIHSKVEIIDTHIFDNVTIEEGAIIYGAIICSNVLIKKNAVISKGCIISFGVTVDENNIVPEFNRICLSQSTSLSDHLTDSGIIYKYLNKSSDETPENDDDDDSATKFNHVSSRRSQSIGCSQEVMLKLCRWELSPSIIEDKDSDSDDVDEETIVDYDAKEYDTDHAIGSNFSKKNQSSFESVLSDMVLSGFAEKHPPDNICMEIKSFKFSQNKTFSQCITGILPSLLQIVCDQNKTKNSIISFSKVFFSPSNFGYSILKPFIQTIYDELSVVENIERFCIAALDSPIYGCFRFVLQIIYDVELVSDDGILRWIQIRESKSSSSEDVNRLFDDESVQQFVQWVKQDDDEED